MTNQPSDPELRQLFQELRARDERAAPPFREIMAGIRREIEEGEGDRLSHLPQRVRIRQRVAWGGTLLAAAAAAILLLLPSRGGSDAEFVRAVRSYSASPAGGAWRSPTDVFLDLPGSDLLTTLPRLGGDRWRAGGTGDPRTNPS